MVTMVIFVARGDFHNCLRGTKGLIQWSSWNERLLQETSWYEGIVTMIIMAWAYYYNDHLGASRWSQWSPWQIRIITVIIVAWSTLHWSSLHDGIVTVMTLAWGGLWQWSPRQVEIINMISVAQEDCKNDHFDINGFLQRSSWHGRIITKIIMTMVGFRHW
jgi:hypothetical protein